jgi:3-oxo-5-alpha-steroid 4-dehydrogenase 3
MSIPIAVPTLIQTFYTLAASSILLAAALPPLKSRFVGYGKTSSTTAPAAPASSPINKLLDSAATLTVPHDFFTHFYILGLGASIFWALQCCTHSTPFQLLSAHSGGGMGIEQVFLAWACFTAQVSRRLYECLYIQRRGSKSRMWILHYFVGLLFYAFMSVGVWIEGSGTSPLPAVFSATDTPPSPR